MNFTRRFRKGKYPQKPPIVPIIPRKPKSPANGLSSLGPWPHKTQGAEGALRLIRQGTIDYKNVVLLRKFITAEGRILPRRISRLTAKQQRYMAKAIKNARMTGFLPFINKSQPLRT